MIKFGFSLILLLSSINSIYSQNRAIQGKVIDEMELLPIIGAYIIVNDSIKIGVTGVDGCFQFETSLPIYKLSFRYIGMEDANLKLSEDCNNIELIMVFMPHYDFMSFQEINIIRKQIYKNLPKLRREAYEKGIFQFPEVCYIQEFSEVNPQDYEGARK